LTNLSKLERFWMGKPPTTRKMIEEYIAGATITQREIAHKYGRPTAAIQKHMTILKLRGLLVRVGYNKREDQKGKIMYEWRENGEKA
jgi:hypothetical protein